MRHAKEIRHVMKTINNSIVVIPTINDNEINNENGSGHFALPPIPSLP